MGPHLMAIEPPERHRNQHPAQEHQLKRLDLSNRQLAGHGIARPEKRTEHQQEPGLRIERLDQTGHVGKPFVSFLSG